MIAVAFAFVASGAAAPDPATPSAAVFTAAQAHDGHAIFTQSCAKCHAAELTGGSAPNLFGPAFTASSLSFGALNQVIAHEMPLDDPGSLNATQYAAVIAYVLASNCYAAGTVPYPTDGTVPNRQTKVATQGGATAPCVVP
jgi:polar amino acid transport system substrate-binding protein